MIRLLAFHGFDGSGKSTAARMVPDAEIIPIAGGLKAFATAMGWQGGKAPRDRQFLRDLGMLGRAYNPDCWIDDWLRRMQSSHARRVVVDDLRFPNEAELIHKLGGIVVRIERPSVAPPWWRRMHPSERPLPSSMIDATIWNDESEAELREAVLSVSR